MACVSVVIADRHPVVVCGLVSLLGAESDFNIAATCCDGMKCIQAIWDLAPDLALLDVSMPRLTGLEVLAWISWEGLSTRVVLLTSAAENLEPIVRGARGAYGVVLKETDPEVLVHCLRQVAAGRRMLGQGLAESAPGTWQRGFSRNPSREHVLATLTGRERQIMRLVSIGLSNKEVARRLKISDGTIKVHLHNMYQKLAINNRTELAALALSKDMPPREAFAAN